VKVEQVEHVRSDVVYQLVRTLAKAITLDAQEDAPARLQIEFEEMKLNLVVDDRSFSSKRCQDALEKFINCILNVSTSKVIMITSRTNESSSLLYSSANGLRIEESTIEIGTLDFRSTAYLFASYCEFVDGKVCPLAHTANEFAELLKPPFVSKMADPSVVTNQRRADFFALMGSGQATAITTATGSISKDDFMRMIKIGIKTNFKLSR
jgi:hypothetical protein